MLRPTPAAWAHVLPGYGADRVLALGVLAAWLFRRGPARTGLRG
jgi:hypothetical protein